MKKIIYTVALLLASMATTQAQTQLKKTQDEIAEVVLLQEDLLIYTQKETGGQYLYTERKGQGPAQRDATLNAGVINSIIGLDRAKGELYVYHKAGPKTEKIAVYRWTDGSFDKKEERPMPRMRNNSVNLGVFLTENKQHLYISAELGKSKGYDDIYLSTWENGRWTKLKSLNSPVNTRQMEFAPFVSNDSLYFSRKQGQESYIYKVAMGQAGSIGEPVQVASNMNPPGAFNAYYKRLDQRDLWITRAPGNSDYIAYLSSQAEPEAPVEPVVEVPMPVEEVKVAKPAPAFNLASPDQRFFYDLDVTFLSEAEAAQLGQFLSQQAAGTTLLVKGYSDKVGSDQARQRVSLKRAANLQWYIQRYHADKGFTVEVQTATLPEKGRNHRRTEIFIGR